MWPLLPQFIKGGRKDVTFKGRSSKAMQFLPRYLSFTMTDSNEGMTFSMKNSNLPEATMLRRNPGLWERPPRVFSHSQAHPLPYSLPSDKPVN